MPEAPVQKLRVDKWLWFARFFKSRGLAAAQVGGGHVRVNGIKIHKTAHAVAPGDVLTFVQGRAVRVIRIEALGVRRGPASEAQGLYTDLDPPDSAAPPQPDNPGFEGKGRPSGRDRRQLDLSRQRHLE